MADEGFYAVSQIAKPGVSEREMVNTFRESVIASGVCCPSSWSMFSTGESGSRLTMDQAFRNFGKHTGAGVEDLFLMAATTPAGAIGIGHLTGTLTPGKWANIVILDKELQLRKVILRGEEVE